MRTVDTQVFAQQIAYNVSDNRSSTDLLKFTKDLLEKYGSPVVDELAEECLETLFSLSSNDFYYEFQMVSYAFTDVMTKWFGDTVNITFMNRLFSEPIAEDQIEIY